MYSSRGCFENRCVSTPARKGPSWSNVPWTAGQGLFVSSLYVRVLQSASFGYRQTEMKHNKFKTNTLTATASQDQSLKPQQEYVFSNLPVSGIQGQTEMKHTKFKTNKLTTAAWTKPKTTRLQKRVSFGVVLMASTMLHENCCSTVLQIGAPLTGQGGKLSKRLGRNIGSRFKLMTFSRVSRLYVVCMYVCMVLPRRLNLLLSRGIPPAFRGGVQLFIPPTAIGSVLSLSAFLRLVNKPNWCRFAGSTLPYTITKPSQSRLFSLLLAASTSFPPRGHKRPPTFHDCVLPQTP